MKHLKPYNKIYSMMCVIVSRVCVGVCRVFVSGLSVSLTCLKDVSKYAATFIMFFAFFTLFLHVFFFSNRYVFLTSKIILCTFFEPRDSIRQ